MRIDTGDTAWVLVSAALVMFMTPGLALFYGGLVRAKNVLGTVMQSLIALGVVTVLWVLVGYSLAFGSDHGLLTGGLEHLGLRGVGADPENLTHMRRIADGAFVVERHGRVLHLAEAATQIVRGLAEELGPASLELPPRSGARH